MICLGTVNTCLFCRSWWGRTPVSSTTISAHSSCPISLTRQWTLSSAKVYSICNHNYFPTLGKFSFRIQFHEKRFKKSPYWRFSNQPKRWFTLHIFFIYLVFVLIPSCGSELLFGGCLMTWENILGNTTCLDLLLHSWTFQVAYGVEN